LLVWSLCFGFLLNFYGVMSSTGVISCSFSNSDSTKQVLIGSALMVYSIGFSIFSLEDGFDFIWVNL